MHNYFETVGREGHREIGPVGSLSGMAYVGQLGNERGIIRAQSKYK